MPDSEALIFKMKEIDEAKLNNHNTIALLYTSLEQNSPISPTPGLDIKALKNEMLGYKDSVIKQIENDDQQFIESIWPREASNELSRKFSAQLNNIFYNYFKNLFPYQAHDSRVEFKFICNPAGRVYTVKDVRSINSLQIKWIEDSFRVFVVPQLRQIDFETMTVQRDNKNLITDFNARFSETINKLNRKDSWVDEVLDIQKKNS